MSLNYIVAIGRQYGSGGHEIGVKLSEMLGIPFYDKELIILASKKSGISQDMLANVDEKATNSLLYSLALGSSVSGLNPSAIDIPLNDKLFIIQSDVMKSLAAQGSCVVIGRCADYVLGEEYPTLSAFIHAPHKVRTERIQRLHELPYDKASDLISKTDKRRNSYYNYYTNRKWGNVDNYHISIDSSKLGIEGTAMLLKDFCNYYIKQIQS